MRLLNLVFWGLAILFATCSEHNQSGAKTLSGKMIGAYNNGLETGHWKSFNESNQLFEEGNFDKGFRVGKWQYYSPMRDSIVWSKFVNKSQRIMTNVPDSFNLEDNEDSLVFFRYYDTTRIFNFGIVKGEIQSIGSLSAYERQLYVDFENRNIAIGDTVSQYLRTKFRHQYMYNKVYGMLPDGKSIVVFNIASIDSAKKVIEVSLRCEKEFVDKGQIIFFSIIPNLFVDSARFLTIRDIITKMK